MGFLIFVLGVVVGAAVLFGVHWWRLRALRHQVAALQRLVRERTEQLEEVNRKLALTSPLDAITNIANRRSFDEQLTMEWRRSRRTRSRLSLLMADIDGFKGFNDAFGRPAGDKCLRAVADVIASCVRRAGDTVARYGGEEFAVLLPDTDVQGAAALAERIRKLIEQQEIFKPDVSHPTMLRAQLTVSIGVATMSGVEAVSPSALERAADAALRQAKRDGRNLVRIGHAATA